MEIILSIKIIKIIINNKPGFDYGFITRITSAQFPDRVFIACVGIGEWGTSGAAWYLSNKWKDILTNNTSWFNPFYLGKGKDFACLIEIKRYYDNSAKLIAHFKTPQSIDDFIKNQTTNITSHLTSTTIPNDHSSFTSITVSPSAEEEKD